METGADPATADAKGLAGMHFAAAHGQLDIVRFLWTKGVEVDSEDPGTQLRGPRCVLLARSRENIALPVPRTDGIVSNQSRCLWHGRMIRSVTSWVHNALDKHDLWCISCSESGRLADPLMLLVDVSEQGLCRAADGRTPLHLAALKGHAPVVEFLLDKGVWADAFDGRDDAPLHLAARQGQLHAVQVRGRRREVVIDSLYSISSRG